MKKVLALVLAAVMAIGVFSTISFAAEADGLTVIAGNDTGVEKKTPEGSFVVGFPQEPVSLEPSNAEVMPGMNIVGAIYDRLVDFNDAGEMENVVAETIEYVDDTTLAIKIKEGIQFHNGTEMKADDVLFTLERLAASSRYATNYALIDFENTTVDDDYSLTVKLTAPYAPLLAYLGHPSAGIVSRAYFEEVGEEGIARNPMGSGPFVFENWVSGDSVTLNVNENYWGEKPSYQQLVFRFIPEATTRMVEFETGALDMITDPSSDDILRLANQEVNDVILYQLPGEKIYRCEMFEGFEPFQDENVRRAIALAINWPASVEISFGTECQFVTTQLPADCRFYMETPGYEYDPEAAKALLAEAGYPDGFTVNAVAAAGSSDAKMLEIIQAQLAEIGITVELETTDIMTSIQKMLSGEANFSVINGTATVKDPDQIMSNIKADSPFSISSKKNIPELNDLLVKGATTVNEEERAAAYADAMNYIYDHAVNVPFAVNIVNYVTYDYVENFPATASGLIDFSAITLK